MTASVGYEQVRAWAEVMLGQTHATVVRTTAWIILCVLMAQRVVVCVYVAVNSVGLNTGYNVPLYTHLRGHCHGRTPVILSIRLDCSDMALHSLSSGQAESPRHLSGQSSRNPLSPNAPVPLSPKRLQG
jgi:hypothetical protein